MLQFVKEIHGLIFIDIYNVASTCMFEYSSIMGGRDYFFQAFIPFEIYDGLAFWLSFNSSSKCARW